jgi:hypothetical protein
VFLANDVMGIEPLAVIGVFLAGVFVGLFLGRFFKG